MASRREAETTNLAATEETSAGGSSINWGMLGTVLAVIGVLVSVWFGLAQRDVRRISVVTESTVSVVDGDATSDALLVTDSLGRPVTSDVYAVEIIAWNSGNVPIDPDVIRRAPVFRLPNADRVLRFAVLDQVDIGVQDARVEVIPDGYQLVWSHMDPGHGVRMVVVYAGERSEVKVDASIVSLQLAVSTGTGRFSWIDYGGPLYGNPGPWAPLRRAGVIWLLCLYPTLIAATLVGNRRLTRKRRAAREAREERWEEYRAKRLRGESPPADFDAHELLPPWPGMRRSMFGLLTSSLAESPWLALLALLIPTAIATWVYFTVSWQVPPL